MRRRALLAALIATSCALAARDAAAYTVRSSPSGGPVRWGTDAVDVVVDGSLADVDPGAASAVAAAFSTWDDVEDAPIPSVVARAGDADEIGYFPGAENHNTVRFARKGSPLAAGALAITLLTFADDGRIVDADVILNGGGSRKFAVLEDRGPASHGDQADDDDHADDGDESDGDEGDEGDHGDHGDHGGDGKRYDVQNVLTHEAGHFFGLGEELEDAEATMFVTSARGETKKRDLASDDHAGIRLLYEGAGASARSGSCGVAREPASDGGAWLALATLGVGAARRARRRRASILHAGTAGALTFLLAAMGCASDGGDAGAVARVVGAEAHWEGGLVVTRLALRSADPRVGELSIDVYGGQVRGFTQIVGHDAVPPVGAVVPLAWQRGKLVWPDRFPGRLAPPAPEDRTPAPRSRARRGVGTTTS